MEPYFQDDFVSLFHADSTEWAGWVEAGDVLVTDPPYGISHAPRGTYDVRTGVWHEPRTKKVRGDETVGVRDQVLALWGDRPAIVFGSWRQPRPANVRHRLIWWKQGQAPGPARAAFMTQDEEIYVLGSGWVESSPPQRSVIPTSEARSLQPSLFGHPTPKPVGLMELLIDRAPPGVVVDPFAGSGATLLAAKRLGRRAIGVEIEREYVEAAADRLAQGVLAFD